MTFLNCFQHLFTSLSPQELDELLNIVKPRVTVAMNLQLKCPYIDEKVFTALCQMRTTKASEHGGLPALFFQQFW